MRLEKELWVEEVDRYLNKSDYVFLTSFDRLTVDEAFALRAVLAEADAEFHVVKNRIFNVVAKKRQMPDVATFLKGQTAIIIGGKNPSGVAKVLVEFHKQKEKVDIKFGLLDGRILVKEEVHTLSKLPSRDELRATFLSLCNTPATQLLRVMQGVPQAFLNVLKAKSEQV